MSGAGGSLLVLSEQILPLFQCASPLDLPSASLATPYGHHSQPPPLIATTPCSHHCLDAGDRPHHLPGPGQQHQQRAAQELSDARAGAEAQPQQRLGGVKE